jgi:hypothetical protein
MRKVVQADADRYIIDIPEEYRSFFEADPITAWQQFGSFGHHSESPYFDNYDAVYAAVKERKNPFDDVALNFSQSFYCDDNNLRFIHVDLAATHDYCGIAMCHVAKWVTVNVMAKDVAGNAVRDRQLRPYIFFDFIGRIAPPDGGEIEFAQIRELIFELDDPRRFPLALITYDRFNSIDSIQILRRHGFNVSHLSTDNTKTYPIVSVKSGRNVRAGDDDSIIRQSTGGGRFSSLAAWQAYKECLNTGRIDLPIYRPVTQHEALASGLFGSDRINVNYVEVTWIEKEMLQAVFDAEHNKVKEPAHGSIDVLEACVGAAFNAINNTEYIAAELPYQKRQNEIRQRRDAKNVFDAANFTTRRDVSDSIMEDVDFADDDSVFEEGSFL